MKLSLTELVLNGNELAYVTDCIARGWLSSKGAYVERFEEAMAAWCGVRHGVATSSGTNALHLALLSLGIEPGDEVILPALSYVASANAVAYTGARPLFVDVDPRTWNMDLDQLASKITPRTRAIMPVHLYGHPVDMATVMAIAAESGLSVVEDACQAHGAEFQGRRTGGLAHVGCFSFYSNKLITTGEGGMLLTDCGAVAATARLLRNQACEGSTYWHSQVGFSYRMTNLQAAVGLAQTEQISQFIVARQVIKAQYDRLLADIPGLTLYAEPGWSRSVCWLYSLLVEPEFGPSRDELISYLARHGVESKPFFQPLPSLPPYQDGRSYPEAEKLSRRGISLPTYPGLRKEQIVHIAQLIQKAPQREGLPG